MPFWSFAEIDAVLAYINGFERLENSQRRQRFSFAVSSSRKKNLLQKIKSVLDTFARQKFQKKISTGSASNTL
jgi:hypothetical protein